MEEQADRWPKDNVPTVVQQADTMGEGMNEQAKEEERKHSNLQEVGLGRWGSFMLLS